VLFVVIAEDFVGFFDADEEFVCFGARQRRHVGMILFRESVILFFDGLFRGSFGKLKEVVMTCTRSYLNGVTSVMPMTILEGETESTLEGSLGEVTWRQLKKDSPHSLFFKLFLCYESTTSRFPISCLVLILCQITSHVTNRLYINATILHKYSAYSKAFIHLLSRLSCT
jgi:hypothetical protein